jgi:hypothetical protein
MWALRVTKLRLTLGVSLPKNSWKRHIPSHILPLHCGPQAGYIEKPTSVFVYATSQAIQPISLALLFVNNADPSDSGRVAINLVIDFTGSMKPQEQLKRHGRLSEANISTSTSVEILSSRKSSIRDKLEKPGVIESLSFKRTQFLRQSLVPISNP